MFFTCEYTCFIDLSKFISFHCTVILLHCTIFNFRFSEVDEFHLEVAMKHPRVVALCDSLLDGHLTVKEYEQQQEVFARHFKLALKLNKPVVLHIRGPNSMLAARSIMKEVVILLYFYPRARRALRVYF
jgi:Tat protein secretion system quality control protein TatD with DNase activity